MSGTSSPLEVAATISTMPSSIQVNASNMSAVQDMIEEEYMHSTGIGTWKATVGIATKPFLLDRGNDISIHFSYSYYEPIITEATSS